MYNLFKFCQAFAYSQSPVPVPASTYNSEKKTWKFESSAVGNPVLKLNYSLLSKKKEKNLSSTVFYNFLLTAA